LVPILPQLISLRFTESYNGQVPYLLRAVLQNGLPQLRSLEIEQTDTGWDDHSVVALSWYETLDSHFHMEENRMIMEWNFMNNYMHSIVRGAPNLEELGLHGKALTSAFLVRTRLLIRLRPS
jgi:hypothetical protein